MLTCAMLMTHHIPKVETTCSIWFTVELGVRFLSAKSKKKFMTSVLTYIDVLSVLPFYVVLAIEASNANNESLQGMYVDTSTIYMYTTQHPCFTVARSKAL